MCRSEFDIEEGTIFYKGGGVREQAPRQMPELAVSQVDQKKPSRGYYTIDVAPTISSLSGHAKARMFGDVSYYTSTTPIRFLDIDDKCWPPLRDAFFKCHPGVTSIRCFSRYMCEIADGWVNREDWGPNGGFEVFMCNPTMLREITREEANAHLEEKRRKKSESAVAAFKRQLESGLAMGLDDD